MMTTIMMIGKMRFTMIRGYNYKEIDWDEVLKILDDIERDLYELSIVLEEDNND